MFVNQCRWWFSSDNFRRRPQCWHPRDTGRNRCARNDRCYRLWQCRNLRFSVASRSDRCWSRNGIAIGDQWLYGKRAQPWCARSRRHSTSLRVSPVTINKRDQRKNTANWIRSTDEFLGHFVAHSVFMLVIYWYWIRIGHVLCWKSSPCPHTPPHPGAHSDKSGWFHCTHIHTIVHELLGISESYYLVFCRSWGVQSKPFF